MNYYIQDARSCVDNTCGGNAAAGNTREPEHTHLNYMSRADTPRRARSEFMSLSNIVAECVCNV